MALFFPLSTSNYKKFFMMHLEKLEDQTLEVKKEIIILSQVQFLL